MNNANDVYRRAAELTKTFGNDFKSRRQVAHTVATE